MRGMIGVDLGRYHIVEQLGVGGMAYVYKALDTHLENFVAIKVLRKDEFIPSSFEKVLKRFEQEAKTLARLNHPNLVKVIDYGQFEDMPYLVMPFLSAGTLKKLMGRPLSTNEAVKIILPIASALSYSHKQGVFHRDIKPSNILITESGEPLLSDFGIAKILEENGGMTITGTGVGLGTPEYMAPEQGLGKFVDGRADVYSLGVVLFELITGSKPYTADTPMAVILKQINDPLPRITSIYPEISPLVETIIIKSLAKNPDDRYQTMDEFTQALMKLINVGNSPDNSIQDTLDLRQNSKRKINKKNAGLTVGIGLIFLSLIFWKFFMPKSIFTQNPVTTMTNHNNLGTPPSVSLISNITPGSITPTQNNTELPYRLMVTGNELFSDSFENGKKADWRLDGNWEIDHDDNGNSVLLNKEPDKAVARVGGFDWKNYSIWSRIKVTKIGDNSDGHILSVSFYSNCLDKCSEYKWEFDRDAFRIGKEAGGWFELGRQEYAFPVNTWMTLRVDIYENQIIGYINNRKAFSVFDNNSLQKGIIRIQIGENTKVMIDSFQVFSIQKDVQ